MEKLADLRRLIAQQTPEANHRQVPLGHAPADAALCGGLRLGALHEVYALAPGDGGASIGFASALAARATNGFLFWIRQDFSALEHGELHAAGLLDLGVDPARVVMLKVAGIDDALRAAGDALGCRGMGAVVIEAIGETKLLDLTASRRLTLAAAEKGVTAILLRLNAQPEASAAETRWVVRAGVSPTLNEQGGEDWGAPVFDVELARNRHGLGGHWVMEWRCDERIFSEPEPADTRVVAAASFDRPDRAPPTWLRRAS